MEVTTLYAVLAGVAVIAVVLAAAPWMLRRLLTPEPEQGARRSDDRGSERIVSNVSGMG